MKKKDTKSFSTDDLEISSDDEEEDLEENSE